MFGMNKRRCSAHGYCFYSCLIVYCSSFLVLCGWRGTGSLRKCRCIPELVRRLVCTSIATSPKKNLIINDRRVDDKPWER